jgi:hypothetical protein
MTPAASPPPPVAPVVIMPPAVPVRTYVLAGCSVGGTLCASLASAATVNLPFAIMSAVFGGVIVLVTAAPGMAMRPLAAPAAIGAAAAALPGGTVEPQARVVAPPERMGGWSIGISAAVLSFIMNQVAQFAVGSAVYGIAGEIPAEYALAASAVMAMSVLMVRVPFDLLIGAYLVTRAKNLFAALGVFLLAYFVCYLVEQGLSMTVGASGLYNTIAEAGWGPVLPGVLLVFGVPLAAQAVGAFGARLASWLTRARS